VKNINSFSFVKKAIEFEVKRQIEILEKGETPKQETRGYDDVHGGTYSQRSKEEAQDYRYFPEPDIPPFNFTETYVEEVKKSLPELPSVMLKRFENEYGVKPIDAFILTRDKKVADLFETVVTSKQINKAGQAVANMIINKRLSTDLTPQKFIEEFLKLTKPVETDSTLLDVTIETVIAANSKAVTDYKAGKVTVIMFLVGQVMKGMKGKADAATVRKALEEKLKV